MTDLAGLRERLRAILPLLDGLETGQDCEEYAFAKAKGFQAMTYCPDAFEALRSVPAATTAIDTLEARVKVLEEALEPFAAMADRLDSLRDDETIGLAVPMRVEQYRRARAALKEQP